MATTADKALPFNGQSAFADDWRDIFGSWLADGVIAGVLNELKGFADSTGRQVKLKSGVIRLDGEHAENSTEKTLAVTANASGSTRTDRLIARLHRDTQVIEFDVLAGTPGTGLPPALTSDTNVLERSVAKIGPLASGYTTIAAGAITDERLLLSSRSLPIYADDNARGLWTPTPRAGFASVLADSGLVAVYDDTDDDWISVNRKHFSLAYAVPGNQDSGSSATWPTGLHLDVDIPPWATIAKLFAKVSKVDAVTAVSNTNVDLRIGSTVVDSQRVRFDPADQNAQTLVFAGDASVTGGTTATLRLLANNVSGTGVLRVGGESTAYIAVDFE